MLPFLRFPDERLIDIVLTTADGLCSIIVWTHQILGLSILVKDFNSQKEGEHHFRSSSSYESVTITIDKSQCPSITLLSPSNHETFETLFKMKLEIDEEEIRAIYKEPARGYGKRAFNHKLGLTEDWEAISREMALVTTAFAICVSRHLHVAHPYEGLFFNDYTDNDANIQDSTGNHFSTDNSKSEEHKYLKVEVTERAIFEAAYSIFDDPKLQKKTIDDYVTKYQGLPLYYIKSAPKQICAIAEGWDNDEGAWPMVCVHAIYLCTLILAFAHVSSLSTTSEFPICQRPEILAASRLSREIAKWDGKGVLQVEEDVWFEIIALLMVGRTGETNLSGTSLVSQQEWSVIMNTFGRADPSYICKFQRYRRALVDMLKVRPV